MDSTSPIRFHFCKVCGEFTPIVAQESCELCLQTEELERPPVEFEFELEAPSTGLTDELKQKLINNFMKEHVNETD
jgi:hypothetical protein